jgi:hypothetical protein
MLQVDVPSAAGAAVVPVTSALMMMLIPAWLPPFETNAAGFKLLTIWNVISESAVWFVLNPALVQPALV